MLVIPKTPVLNQHRGETTLCVDSSRISECMAQYRPGVEVCVNPSKGYALDNLDFLRRYPFITSLAIVSPLRGDFDLEPITALRSLRTLLVNGPLRLELDAFPELDTLRGVWHPDLDLAPCKRLQVLAVRKYKSASRNLAMLPDLPALRELELVQPGITSLDGVERFQGLKLVDLAYALKLQDVSALCRLPGLEVVHCQNCRKLEDVAQLQCLTRLRSLRLNRCADLPSIKFLEAMTGLEEFRFVGTNVVDGDLTPLLGLKWVGFNRNKRYSHTPEQLDPVLRAKGGGAVVRLGDYRP